MADKVPPEGVEPEGGSNIPSKVTPPGDSDLNANMEKQMQIFKENFMAQFDDEYKEKITKLNSDNGELEERKQRLAVSEEIRALGIDSNFIDFVYDKDIEISKVKIKQLEGMIKSEADKETNKRMRVNSYTPPKNNGNITTKGKSKPKYFI